MNEVVFNIDKLRSIAMNQYGYVTTSQATTLGVSKPSLAMLVKRGRLEHLLHGIYRVPQIAPTTFDRFMLALLWTGCAEATLSHETALEAYEICTINPTTIHITVGNNRRIRRAGGKGYTLHRQNLNPSQIGWWEEMPITKPQTTIEQCMHLGTPDYLLTQAIENGNKRGLLNRSEAEKLKKKLEEK